MATATYRAQPGHSPNASPGRTGRPTANSRCPAGSRPLNGQLTPLTGHDHSAADSARSRPPNGQLGAPPLALGQIPTIQRPARQAGPYPAAQRPTHEPSQSRPPNGQLRGPLPTRPHESAIQRPTHHGGSSLDRPTAKRRCGRRRPVLAVQRPTHHHRSASRPSNGRLVRSGQAPPPHSQTRLRSEHDHPTGNSLALGPSRPFRGRLDAPTPGVGHPTANSAHPAPRRGHPTVDSPDRLHRLDPSTVSSPRQIEPRPPSGRLTVTGCASQSPTINSRHQAEHDHPTGNSSAFGPVPTVQGQTRHGWSSFDRSTADSSTGSRPLNGQRSTVNS